MQGVGHPSLQDLLGRYLSLTAATIPCSTFWLSVKQGAWTAHSRASTLPSLKPPKPETFPTAKKQIRAMLACDSYGYGDDTLPKMGVVRGASPPKPTEGSSREKKPEEHQPQAPQPPCFPEVKSEHAHRASLTALQFVSCHLWRRPEHVAGLTEKRPPCEHSQ